MIIILDNIRSAHNVGSIFRTADAVGWCEKIVLCGITPTPIDRFGRANERIAKVALGAEKTMAWKEEESAVDVVQALKNDLWYIIALEQDSHAMPYSSFWLPLGKRQKTALVLGDEVEGVSQGVLDRTDAILEIPMRGMKESLNVAIAFGIVGFHVLREKA
jgi:23S rRNA (guanosine2251-2'-O)-methyltransferase